MMSEVPRGDQERYVGPEGKVEVKTPRRVLILYNLATQLKKGVETDLVCEQEISVIVPLMEKLLTDGQYSVKKMETDLNLWEKLKSERENLLIWF